MAITFNRNRINNAKIHTERFKTRCSPGKKNHYIAYFTEIRNIMQNNRNK